MSGYYAGDGRIGTAQFEGSVEISEAQYSDALEGMMVGKIVTVDGGFAVIDPPLPPEPEPEPAPEPISLSDYAAAKRYEVETGGIAVNGATIRTDTGSQSRITGAYTLTLADPTLTTIDWEAQPGEWVTVDAATMKAIGIAVGRHVQSCFSTLRAVQTGIANGTITTTDEIDTFFTAASAL